MPDERIQFLIDNLHESLDVEVKNWLGGLANNEEKARLAKEIIALANNGGGYIFIGFDDEGDGHPEIEPPPATSGAFSQDKIADVVKRYVKPPCQCRVGLYQRKDSTIEHPVITVPGDHRTPVWAARSSPDQSTLRTDTVYVRRPGGSSEPPKTQDDWEKLLERLLRARGTDLLDAIREIMHPSKQRGPDLPALATWHEDSLSRWRSRVDPLPDGDARKLDVGYWTFSFEITPFAQPSLSELIEFLRHGVRRYSGWPPFTYLDAGPRKPKALGNDIEAWLAAEHDRRQTVAVDERCDFWRLSKQGTGFLLRPMQEDRSSYLRGAQPGNFFDYELPVYRATELLKFVEAMAVTFVDRNTQYAAKLCYHGMEGRTLRHHRGRTFFAEGARCSQDVVQSHLSGSISDFEHNLDEVVYKLLYPIYEQFEFTELPMAVVNATVRDALSY